LIYIRNSEAVEWINYLETPPNVYGTPTEELSWPKPIVVHPSVPLCHAEFIQMGIFSGAVVLSTYIKTATFPLLHFSSPSKTAKIYTEVPNATIHSF
jgi:hypothetical protein